MIQRTEGVPLAGMLALSASFLWSAAAQGAGDAARGATVFQACAACHSMAPGQHLTGPSLATVWGKKAGTVEGFHRYSDAMARVDFVWTEGRLEAWLANPEGLVPGTSMTFPGLRDDKARQDVIAYLKAVALGAAPAASPRRGGMAMHAGPSRQNLKDAPPEGRVTALTRCEDTYTVTTADGKVNKVWEFNLRLKTDSSALGPHPGKPVIVGAGMQGDRASVVFAAPGEISAFIRTACPAA